MPSGKRKVLKLVTPRTVVNEDVVSLLESMLEQARRGELESVGIAFVRADRTIGHHWSESYVGTLLGSINRLQWCLNKAAYDAAKP